MFLNDFLKCRPKRGQFRSVPSVKGRDRLSTRKRLRFDEYCTKGHCTVSAQSTTPRADVQNYTSYEAAMMTGATQANAQANKGRNPAFHFFCGSSAGLM